MEPSDRRACSRLAGGCAAYAVLCRADIGFCLGARSLKSLYSFGARISLIGFGEFIGSNLDTLWTGHFLGSRATGFYTRATNLAAVPLYYFVTSLSRVLLPVYSRIQSERERLKSTYLATITVFGAIILPLSWGVAGAAHEIIFTLLGGRWAPAVPVLAILALGAPLSLLEHFGAILSEATATLDLETFVTAGDVGVLAILLIVLGRFGIVGIASAFALSELALHIAYLFVMRRLLALRVGELWRAHAVGLAAGAVTALALLGLHVSLANLGWPAPAVLAVQLATGTVCLLGTVVGARNGMVWREIRWRLVEAGFKPDGSSTASWFMRRIDSLTRGELPSAK